jgi:hypothetical protein
MARVPVITPTRSTLNLSIDESSLVMAAGYGKICSGDMFQTPLSMRVVSGSRGIENVGSAKSLA